MSRLFLPAVPVFMVLLLTGGCQTTEETRKRDFETTFARYLVCNMINILEQKETAKKSEQKLSYSDAFKRSKMACKDHGMDAAVSLLRKPDLMQNRRLNSARKARNYILPLVEERAQQLLVKS